MKQKATFQLKITQNRLCYESMGKSCFKNFIESYLEEKRTGV